MTNVLEIYFNKISILEKNCIVWNFIPKNIITFGLILLWCELLNLQDPLCLNFRWFDDHNLIIEKTGNCGSEKKKKNLCSL